MLGEATLRRATIERLNRRWSTAAETLIVEELGTHFGASRVDIAVVNGALWGYEIKSAADRLTRLPTQVVAFSEVFDYVTVVAAKKHLARCLEIVPTWWGVIGAVEISSSVVLKEHRKPTRNTSVNPAAVASLLWKDELIAALTTRRPDGRVRSASRPMLIEKLAAESTIADLGETVRNAIRARQAWRVGPEHMRDAERSRLEHTSSGFLARRVRSRRH